jgi:hypothetical protein
MSSGLRTVSAQIALMFAAWSLGVSAQAPSRPSASVNPFVGTWVLSISKSTYNGVQSKQQSTRTLDTYGEGTIVATHRRTNEDGNQGFSYWVGNLSGREFPEYARQRGNTPGNMVSIKPVSPHEWDVTFRNQKGQIVLTDRWTVSPDRKTLTISRQGTRANGQLTRSVEVYDNDGFAVPSTSR